MIPVRFSVTDDQPFRILALGAHADDIEIGCGATILSLIDEYEPVEVCWAVFSGSQTRSAEARKSAEKFLDDADDTTIELLSYRDGFFPWEGYQIKEEFERLKNQFEPDIILTHYRDDRHQDHRIISDLTWNTWRSHVIWEYEIPKYDGDLGRPNMFVPVDADLMDRKIEILMECFATQSNRHWFGRDTFRALARLRGIESAAESGFAEAFYSRKMVL